MFKIKALCGLAALAAFTVLTAASASAFTYELATGDCDADGCQGSEFLLGVDDLGGGSFNVTLEMDASGFTGNRDGIGQVGFKAFSMVEATNVTLTSAPGGVGAWDTTTESTVNSNVSNGGCDSGSTSNHLCTDGFVDITGGGTYTWTWSVTGASILPVGDWHIGGQYCDGDPDSVNCRGQIISTSASATPEPSAALIFGAALLAAAPRLRRRRR